jgi:hypothetical protein
LITGSAGDSSVPGFSFNEQVVVDAGRPEAIDLSDIGITGPEGAITPTGLSPTNARDFQVTFGPTGARGVYAVSVGPNVADLAGNLINTDGDAQAGLRDSRLSRWRGPQDHSRYERSTRVEIR